MPAQRKYPGELRERAVKMVSEVRSQGGKGRARSAGRPRSWVFTWRALRGRIRQAEIDKGRGRALPRRNSGGSPGLEKENREPRRGNEILHGAYLARDVMQVRDGTGRKMCGARRRGSSCDVTELRRGKPEAAVVPVEPRDSSTCGEERAAAPLHARAGRPGSAGAENTARSTVAAVRGDRVPRSAACALPGDQGRPGKAVPEPGSSLKPPPGRVAHRAGGRPEGLPDGRQCPHLVSPGRNHLGTLQPAVRHLRAVVLRRRRVPHSH